MEEEGEDKNDSELRVYWVEDDFVGFMMNQLREFYMELKFFEARCKKGKKWGELCENLKKITASLSRLREDKLFSNFSTSMP